MVEKKFHTIPIIFKVCRACGEAASLAIRNNKNAAYGYVCKDCEPDELELLETAYLEVPSSEMPSR